LITALGINGVGEVMASELAKKYTNLDELSCASMDELLKIEGIGPNIANQIVEWFNQDRNKQILSKLKEVGVWPQITKSEKTIEKEMPLDGKIFVVTGALERFSRTEIKEVIESLGGKTSSSVSKNTDFVLVGESPGSKFDKARELGIKILNEEEFIKMTNLS
jgi:DNA ligase (NAD+)